MSRPYFARIESLRALGALAVATFHFGGWQVHGTPLLPLASLEWIPAHAALLLFFVVSGFVLRVALDYGPQSLGPAAVKFLIGRLFRVYPIVFVGVGLALTIPLCRVGAGPMDPLRNLLLLDVTANGTLWALQLEMLLVPIIFLTWRLERVTSPRVILVLAIVTSGLACEPKWALWPPLSKNLFAFLLGMTIPTYGRALVSRLPGTLTLVVAALAAWLSQPYFGIYSHVGGIVQGYAAFVVVSFAVYRADVLKSLDWPPLQALGRAAGSLYVLHMATLQGTILLASSVVFHMSSVVGVLILLTWLAALCVLALAGYRCIESPGIALGKRLAKRLDPPRLPVNHRRAA